MRRNTGELIPKAGIPPDPSFSIFQQRRQRAEHLSYPRFVVLAVGLG
ncbi:hypothetical protein [Prochlorothrix hollandica]|nr:hypothetical protein [Prochlorothrix hollandica]